MMSDDLPEDQDRTIKSGYKSVVYTLDKSGNYTRATRLSWEPEDIALGQTWEEINEKAEKIKKGVIAGEVSPIAYYMVKYQFSLRRLSNDTGLAKRKIKKHLSPQAFKALDQETLTVYANIFNITVEHLRNPLF